MSVFERSGYTFPLVEQSKFTHPDEEIKGGNIRKQLDEWLNKDFTEKFIMEKTFCYIYDPKSGSYVKKYTYSKDSFVMSTLSYKSIKTLLVFCIVSSSMVGNIWK